MPRMFQNRNFAGRHLPLPSIGFGVKSNRKPVADVIIPRNKKNKISSYFEYTMDLRRSLRDFTYCKNLNLWIDIIFGNKQQSRSNLNVFFEFASMLKIR